MGRVLGYVLMKDELSQAQGCRKDAYLQEHVQGIGRSSNLHGGGGGTDDEVRWQSSGAGGSR